MPKTILITGGSRGIGAATALLAAQRGYAVCLSYLHNQAAAENVVASIEALGGQARAFRADVALESDVVALFERIDAEVGPLAALVNNAGILERQMRVDHMDAARLQRIFATNVIGSFLCAREAVLR
ncbi:sugar dehydrogenase, partial [Kouleothrix aurantiaca]